MAEATATNVLTNPLAEVITAQVQKKFVEMKDVNFHFRTTEVVTGNTVKDKEGKEVPEVKDWKRPTFKAQLPHLTITGLITALQAGDKSTELALEMVNEAVIDRARGIINDAIESNPAIELAQSLFDMEKLSFVAIANLPKSERGAGIAKEAWMAFVKDYKEVMATKEAISQFPDKKARDSETLEKHGVLLGGKFNQVRTRKDVVTQMLSFLDVWAVTSQNAEEHLACYEHLRAKGNAILQGENFDDL